MTQQFPLILAAASAQPAKRQQQPGTAFSMGVPSAELGTHDLPQMAASFTQHDLLAWIMATSKPGAEQQLALRSPRHHLQLDADALASEMNSACGASPEHVVPQAPGSPDSPLEASWASPALPPTASPGAEAQPPATPELQLPAPSEAARLLKRKWDAYEHMPIQPRTHRRKNLHPHRAAEAVANDWDSHPSPVRSSTPPASLKKYAAPARRTPERIHRKPVPLAKSRNATIADGSSATKECADCHTLKTPMWRRVEGITYCNACGLRRTRAMVGR